MSERREDWAAGLRAWQRFHVRITAVYTLVVFLVLTLAALVGGRAALDAAMADLRSRMQVAVIALADGIDPHWIEAPDDTTRATMARRFEHAASAAPLGNFYVLRYDPDPTRLSFVVDWDPGGDDPAEPGEAYDASDVPVLLEGFHHAAIEDEPYEDDWGPSLSAYAPIPAADGGPLGLVGVDVRLAQLKALKRRIVLATVGAWVAAAALVGIASWRIGRNVRDPLTRVIDAASRIADGRFDTRLALPRDDEFGLLSRHFDEMAAGLQEREVIRATFGRYVAPEVARRLIAEHRTELGGEERLLTVLFADLQGYSTISEQLAPRELVALLNAWLGEMQGAIDAHEGTVIEFLGDAILAVFGAPSSQPDHAERAVRCALDMRERLAGLRERLDIPLAHRVGIHTGLAVAGNIGSETRTKYTVIGDAVNVAARLEQLNKTLGTDILVSGTTLEACSPGLVATQDHGEIQVKGRVEPVHVFAPTVRA
ncbi:MAG: HAMP domain-containing protein [Alphaproteobacteria bacterium]|nr:HAMP domain-containing protein [Alphaproteobacteria bacterium]